MVSNGFIVSNRRFSIQAKSYFNSQLFGLKIRCFQSIKGDALKNILNNVPRLLSVNQKLPISGKYSTSFINPFENQFLIVRTVAVIAKIRIAASSSAKLGEYKKLQVTTNLKEIYIYFS